MKPGRELDALIAEKVMGWKRLDAKVFVEKGFNLEPDEIGQIPSSVLAPPDLEIPIAASKDSSGFRVYCPPIIPDYSTDIAAAWEVVEKVKNKIINRYGFGLEFVSNEWTVGWFAEEGVHLGACSESAPHAICLAALQAAK